MGRGNIDLDRSLDDIIKHNKSRSPKDRRPSTQPPRGGKGGRPTVNTRVFKPSIVKERGNASTINRRIGSSTADRNSSNRINSRLNRGPIPKPPRGGINVRRDSNGRISVGRGQSSRPVSTAPRVRGPDMSKPPRRGAETERRNSIDPKSLVITKDISRRKQREPSSDESIVIQSNLSQQRNTHQTNVHSYQNQPPHTSYNNNSPIQSIPQNNNLGGQKNIVLVCNLDPRATAADVGEACSTFGPILSCDILLDPMGRPLNEAEIEFLYPNSAEECVAKLDNSIADGRLVRARLQSSATLPVVPRYSSRTVVGSARVQDGFDNPQSQPVPMNYQDHYQNNNYGNNHSSYSRSHQQQYQRRY